jgi:Rho GDP-dissociation inhibitor/dynein assembly factor 5
LEISILTQEGENETNYKPPPQKTIEEILESDIDHESLQKYKEKLLGDAKTGTVVVGE